MKKIIVLLSVLMAVGCSNTPNEKDPSNMSAKQHYNNALTLIDEDKMEEAIAALDQAIAKDPKYTKALYERGEIKFFQEDFAGALKDLEQVVQLDKKNKDAYNYSGICRMNLDDHAGAINDFSAIIDMDAKDANALYNRGTCKHATGDTDGACKDIFMADEYGDSERYYNKLKELGCL